MDARTDEQLLAEFVAKDDRDAFGALVSRRWPEAYRVALRLLGDPGAAEDAAQDALVSLARSASSFDAGKPFGPWFGAIVVNAARTSRRSRSRRDRHERVAARPELAHPEGERRVEAAELRAALDELPFDERAAVVLHHLEGCSLDEVARRTGSKKSTTQSRVQRGLELLRTALAGAEVAGALALESGRKVAAPAAPSVASILERARVRAPRVAPPAFKVAASIAAAAALAGVAFAMLASPGGAPAVGPAPAPGPVARGDAPAKGSGDARGGTDEGPSAPSPRAPSSSEATSAPRGPGFVVTVRDSSGRPLAATNVSIRVNPTDEFAKRFPVLASMLPTDLLPCATRARATTDANGEAVVTGIAPGARVVLAARRGVETARVEVTAPGRELAPVTLALTPATSPRGAVTIVARVRTPAGPLRSARLSGTLKIDEPFEARDARLKRDPKSASPFTDEHGWLELPLDLETDDEGAFVLRELPPADLRLSVAAPELAALACDGFWKELAAGAVAETTLDFKARAAISGRVAGARPSPSFVQVASTAGGGGTFPVGEDGSWSCGDAKIIVPTKLTITLIALGRACATRELAVDRAEPVVAPELSFDDGATVNGRLVGRSGRAVAPTYVLVSNESGRVVVARSAEDGSFEARGLARGRYRVELPWAREQERAPEDRSSFFHLEAEPRKLSARFEVGSDPVVSLGDLVVKGRAIAGTVVRADGQPAGGAEVALLGQHPARAVADALGRFAFESIEEWSSFELSARSGPWFLPEPVYVDGKDADAVRLTLIAGSVVSGTVARGDGRDLAVAAVNAEGRTSARVAVGPDGRYSLVLAPGRWRLAVWGSRGFAPREVELVALEEKTVDLAASKAALTVRVRGIPEKDAKGKEPRDARFRAVAYRGTLRDGFDVSESLGQSDAEHGVCVFDELKGAPDGVLVQLRLGTDEHEYMMWKEGIGSASEVVFDYPDLTKLGTLPLHVDLGNQPPVAKLGVLIAGDGFTVWKEIRRPEDRSVVDVPLPAGKYRVVVPAKRIRRGDKVDVSSAPAVTIEARGKATEIVVRQPPASSSEE